MNSLSKNRQHFVRITAAFVLMVAAHLSVAATLVSPGFHWNAPRQSDNFNGVVRTILVWDDGSGDAVYAGGLFTEIDGVPVAYLAKRTESGWVAVGGGTNGPVLALHAYAGQLIVGGIFTVAGTTPSYGRRLKDPLIRPSGTFSRGRREDKERDL